MTNILKNAEPFFYQGNDIGVLVIHGFTGTTQSMSLVGEALAKAGYTVLAPRLTGHGTTPEDMAKASYKDWINDVESALVELKKRAKKIFVLGLSMGGALTCYLGETHPELLGIMPINAAIDMPALKEIYDAQYGKEEFIAGIGSDIKKPNVIELAYERTPIKSMGDIVALMAMVRVDLPKITVPTLIFSSNIDHVVPPSNSQEILDRISSANKKLVSLPESYHVATLDNDLPLIVEEAIAFIEANKP
ncbi:alpha/beta hydrolase [Wohlfahrtiimonas populi]|uniref:alpha/beta hydrolase n=1 Tax=Wohlfahrtiimonas populi TaxID=1940240 RepID=UPI00098D3231|nr:alpha/beta fold hydrolase [Wohlfahrtiimonas populi]